MVNKGNQVSHCQGRNTVVLCFLILKDFIYFQREGNGGRKRGRETSMCERSWIGCLSHTPNQRPGPQPRLVPWPGVKLVIFHFVGGCPTNWATPVKSCGTFFFFLRFHLFIFRESGERERNISVWEIHQSVASCTLPPQLGTWLATRACALTGN